jgi:hypothetical protein
MGKDGIDERVITENATVVNAAAVESLDMPLFSPQIKESRIGNTQGQSGSGFGLLLFEKHLLQLSQTFRKRLIALGAHMDGLGGRTEC